MQRLKLNIGCGLNVAEGWVNIDTSLNARLSKWPWLRKALGLLHIISSAQANIPWPKNIYVYDVRKGLPFPDNSTEIIYSSHFLEHLNKEDALFFMKECYRVLDHAGRIRIVVPDLAGYVEQYIKRIREDSKEMLVKEKPADRFLENLCILEKEPINESFFFRFYKNLTYSKNVHRWMYDEYSLTASLQECGFATICRKRCYESLIKDIEKLDDPTRFNDAICLEAQKL